MKTKTAILYTADVPNVNGIIYPKEELEKAVEKFNKEPHYATYDKYPPDNWEIDTLKIVGPVKLRMEDGKVIGDIECTDTPASKKLHEDTKVLPSCIGILNEDQDVVTVTDITISHVICCEEIVKTGKWFDGEKNKKTDSSELS